MHEYDEKVVSCFFENQRQLFPKDVVSDEKEAAYFLEDMEAVVVDSVEEVIQYFEEAGTDFEKEDILEAAEVFQIGDGRYLIVEG